MASCKECIHFDRCKGLYKFDRLQKAVSKGCSYFKDRSRFVELKSAEWIEDEDMYGDPIFRCSNCEARFVLEEGTPEDNDYCYCPTCGAKIQEQALKERGSND